MCVEGPRWDATVRVRSVDVLRVPDYVQGLRVGDERDR